MITFNNNPLPNFIKITGYSYSVLPEITHKNTTVPHLMGDYDSGVSFGAITHSFDFTLIKDGQTSDFEYINQFKKWARGDKFKPSELVFLDEPDYYILARVATKIDISDMFIYGEGSFEMVSSNPIKYSKQDFVINSINNKIDVNYEGLEDACTEITINITNDCTNIKIKQTNTGKESSLLGSFKRGQVVKVDSFNKVGYVDNNITMKMIDLDHDWLYLEEGLNKFEITTPTSGTVLTGSIKYKEEY